MFYPKQEVQKQKDRGYHMVLFNLIMPKEKEQEEKKRKKRKIKIDNKYYLLINNIINNK